MARQILITGGAGYIGSHAVRRFLELGDKVVVVDNLSRGWRQSIEILSSLGDLEFFEIDLRDREALSAVFQAHQFDVVLHFAALCSVDESMKEPALYFDNNVGGTLNLLEIMTSFKVNKLVFSSTCAVYGEAQYLPLNENHQTMPANPYGESKLMAEKMIQWHGCLHNLSYVILRYFNVCGASEDGLIGDSKKPSMLLMQNAVRGAMGIENFSFTCPVVDTPDGTPIRDYIDVEDLISAHEAAVNYMDFVMSAEIFNLGNGRGYSVKEIVNEVSKHFELELYPSQATPRLGEYSAVYADASKAQSLLNWKPRKDLKASVASLGKWYQRRPQGYDN